jgi:hypothetical protein
MKKKKTVDPKFLVLIVIVCFLLSLLLFFIFDVPSSTMDLADIRITKEISSQEIAKLKREGFTAEDLEKLLRDYDKKSNK